MTPTPLTRWLLGLFRIGLVLALAGTALFPPDDDGSQ